MGVSAAPVIRNVDGRYAAVAAPRSNTGSFAFAAIIRTVSGEPWDAFLQKRLLQPRTTSSRARCR
jgi:hypothetical protein